MTLCLFLFDKRTSMCLLACFLRLNLWSPFSFCSSARSLFLSSFFVVFVFVLVFVPVFVLSPVLSSCLLPSFLPYREVKMTVYLWFPSLSLSCLRRCLHFVLSVCVFSPSPIQELLRMLCMKRCQVISRVISCCVLSFVSCCIVSSLVSRLGLAFCLFSCSLVPLLAQSLFHLLLRLLLSYLGLCLCLGLRLSLVLFWS